MTTRKDLIICKYQELLQEVKPFLGDTFLFPEDIDVAELCFFVSFIFNGDDDYSVFKTLLSSKNITLEETKARDLFNIVIYFIEWLKNLH